MPAATGSAAATQSKDQQQSKKKTGKHRAFDSTTQRAMHVELMGEDTPGPGSYLPASTFGKYSKMQTKSSKKQSSSFSSTSPQRPRALNLSVPGAGAYSPKKESIEKNSLNPSAQMKSKAKRFSQISGTTDTDKDRRSEPGPGEYDAHNFKTIQAYLAKKRERMSRQNPGFGASTPAHTLPYEQDIVNDQKPFMNYSPPKGDEHGSPGFGGAHGGGVPQGRRGSTVSGDRPTRAPAKSSSPDLSA